MSASKSRKKSGKGAVQEKSTAAAPNVHDPQALWYFGEWQQLVELEPDITAPPATLSNQYLLKAAAHLQLGEMDGARHALHESLALTDNVEQAARVSVACANISMAKIELLRHNKAAAQRHIETSFTVLGDITDLASKTRSRMLQCLVELGLLPEAAEILDATKQDILAGPYLESRRLAMGRALSSEIELLNQNIQQLLRNKQLYTPEDIEQGGSASDEHARAKRASTSQLGQDLWVIEANEFKRDGFFVEFGATDGILLSNTYMLEQAFGWRGICAEPNPHYFEQLEANRNCTVAPECISAKTGDTVEFLLANEFSTIASYADADTHAERRAAYDTLGNSIEVNTISLNDFLDKYDAPDVIDYLSIDTEGSEYDILSKLDFKRWDIRRITVEHNFSELREKIHKLLKRKGYTRQEADWDDWYYKPDKTDSTN